MYIGFDVGGTTIKYGLVNEHGEIIEKGSIETRHHKDGFLTDLVEIVTAFQEKSPLIKGIGISAPGVIQKNGFMTTAGAIKPLYGTNLQAELEQRCGLPTRVENDANAAAIAEKWIGNAQELDNYLCIVIGTGIGGGIVINGDVYRGAHGMAGEFGWMMIDQLPEEGNLESVSLNQRAAVVGGLCRIYNEASQAKGSEAIWDAREILQRGADGEELAKVVLTKFYQDLAVGLVNLIGIFDPEAILVGGGISASKEFIADLVAAVSEVEDRHESIHYMKNEIAPILPAGLRNDAGMIGAVYKIHQVVSKKQLEKSAH